MTIAVPSGPSAGIQERRKYWERKTILSGCVMALRASM